MLPEVMQARPPPVGGATQTDLSRQRIERAVDVRVIQPMAPARHEEVGRHWPLSPVPLSSAEVVGEDLAR
jgi:hypothetical protein